MPDPAFLSDADRLHAIRTRDTAADGAFVFSVRSTGIYCRPSCPARPARTDNIGFHASPAAAEAAGFRPCRRCHPAEKVAPAVEAVVRACRLITHAAEPPSLAQLARAAGLSRHHFHRLFKATTGVTPKAYAAAGRANRTADTLQANDGRITDAVYAAGFSGPSRFYAATEARFGMTPGALRRGGANLAIRYATGPCTLGTVLAATTARGLCAILLGDDPSALLADLRARFPRAAIAPAAEDFAATLNAVVALVDGPARPGPLPLDIQGTAFQQRVWEALRRIPPGTTTSYAALAEAIGAPAAVRAVAGACAANPLAVIVPCHRVVRRNGDLGGYRWGLARKTALLASEAEATGARPGP